MPTYRIYRMKDSPRRQFRWAPHLIGSATIKPKDYDPGDQIEAANEYDAWHQLRESELPLQVGDLLEAETGALCICKYVGFEPAQWVLSEVKAEAEPYSGSSPAAAGPEQTTTV